jgi:hypothetical protein
MATSSPTPGTYDTTVEQGVGWQRVLTWRDGAGALVPMSGYVGKMQLRARPGGPVLLELNSADDSAGIVLGAADGTITLHIDEADTALLPAAVLRYELDLIPPSADPLRLIEGRLTVRARITAD